MITLRLFIYNDSFILDLLAFQVNFKLFIKKYHNTLTNCVRIGTITLVLGFVSRQNSLRLIMVHSHCLTPTQTPRLIYKNGLYRIV